MKPMDLELAWVVVIFVAGLAFVIIGAWATADQVSRLAYWVRRIQAGIVVIALVALFIWAAWSLIAGGAL